jgi:methylated-DNA-[protein]-cysteine S-methyltransferase
VADRVTQLRFTTVPTPLGNLTVLASDAGVVATLSDDERAAGALDRWEARLEAPAREAARALAPVRRELEAYFARRLRDFSVAVDLRSVGDGFGRRVLEAVRGIPYGELRTYGDMADAAGNPRAGRAAGSALRRCPVEILVPCHRVVGAGKGLGGYGGHDDRKAALLRLEGAI